MSAATGRRFADNRLALAGGVLMVLLVLAAVAAPLLAPEGYNRQAYEAAYEFPSPKHLMGTDGLGREILIRVLYGAQVSLEVGLASQVLAYIIGVPLGAIAGFEGGRFDFLLMRFVDAMTAFPSLLFAILIMSLLGPGLWQVLLAIGLTGWIGGCRMTLAQLLQLREADYVLAARSLGATNSRLIWRHLPSLLTGRGSIPRSRTSKR